MPTFIQLRDNIGFAVVHAHGEVDHSVTPDHTNAIEVDAENAEEFLKKKYNAETKTWSEAELIYFAELNHRGEITEIRRTYFPHEVTGPVLTPDTPPNARWVDNEWFTPEYVIAEQPPIIAPAEIEPPFPLD